VLHGAYFAYYFIVTIPAAWFLWRGDLVSVRRFVLTVMTTFVFCYLVFIFFPVAGPYYVFPRPAAWFLDNPAALGSRRLGLCLLAPTILLTVGVVYCQMHYGVDALAGLAVGSLAALAVSRVPLA
jgi:hypothetical protein